MSRESDTFIKCPKCGRPCRVYECVCARCGANLEPIELEPIALDPDKLEEKKQERDGDVIDPPDPFGDFKPEISPNDAPQILENAFELARMDELAERPGRNKLVNDSVSDSENKTRNENDGENVEKFTALDVDLERDDDFQEATFPRENRTDLSSEPTLFSLDNELELTENDLGNVEKFPLDVELDDRDARESSLSVEQAENAQIPDARLLLLRKRRWRWALLAFVELLLCPPCGLFALCAFRKTFKRLALCDYSGALSSFGKARRTLALGCAFIGVAALAALGWFVKNKLN